MPAGRAADVIVVGGGAGGITAARRAAQLGASVVLVTDGPLGGDCTHTGCVPSKTLLAQAASGAGFTEAMESVRAAVAAVAAAEDEGALGADGVTVLQGRATLAGPRRVEVDGVVLSARAVILATGAVAALPPVPGLDSAGALTSDTVWALDHRPDRLVVMGGGAIGCELSQAFARFGTAVTLVEGAPRLVPAEDPAVSALLARSLGAEGVEVVTAARIEEATAAGGDPTLVLASPGARDRDATPGTVPTGTVPTGAPAGDPTCESRIRIRGDTLLVAAGRRPDTAGLGLEELGVACDRAGRIEVDDTCATTVAGVWAVGDATTRGGLTHMAAHMGFVAATNAWRGRHGRSWRPGLRAERRAVPRVIFTDPEVAQVGLTEAEAAPLGARVAEVNLATVDRARTDGRSDGFVKLVAGPRRGTGWLGGGQVLGATVVCPRAGELISEVALAMRTRAFTGRLAQTIHPYPSWSVALQQAASQFFFAVDGHRARDARS